MQSNSHLPSPDGGSIRRGRLVGDYIGIPYVDRGRDATVGLDCWGLLRLFYAEQFGVVLPSHDERYLSSELRDQTCALARDEIARAWAAVDAPAFGDAVVLSVLGRPFHVGIALDSFRFLHTLRPEQGAVIESLQSPAWARRIDSFYRLMER